MTLIGENAELRPAALSYVKPSEYRRSVEDFITRALALLDAAREDREALTIADEWFACCDCITTETGTDDRKKRYRELRRAAIDKARGDG